MARMAMIQNTVGTAAGPGFHSAAAFRAFHQILIWANTTGQPIHLPVTLFSSIVHSATIVLLVPMAVMAVTAQQN